jgi:rsbT co-antagonist protein RsbR
LIPTPSFDDQSELMSLEELIERHQITEEDLTWVRRYGQLITSQLETYKERFYQWMSSTPEFSLFFHDDRKLERVKGAQGQFWMEFFRAELDERYVESRRHVGEIHAHVGLTLPVYFAGINYSQDLWLYELYEGGLSKEDRERAVRAFIKLMQLDASIVVAAYSRLTHDRLSEQAHAMMEMSTPVTSLWDHILMLPVVGIIDSRRAANMMSSVLHKISETRAKVFIIDIGGVSVVDTAVANHLIKITQAARLMGCICLLSGVSPAIAQTTIELGIDVGNVLTRATMRDALEEAFRLINVEVNELKMRERR